MATMSTTATRTGGMTKDERFVIVASSLGTVFEWYDFYLFGSLAAIIGSQFFGVIDPATKLPMFNQATRDIFALLAFAAGFIVRPFGALVFGRVGDIVGRKYTFLVTIVIMGLSTFIVGLLPSAASIGIAAPIILISLRLLQGLALGGEYGGAATYVAEHSPMGQRGYYTSFIQTTATLGLFLSLLVILFTRTILGEPEFAAWGWRVPFLVSILLLGTGGFIIFGALSDKIGRKPIILGGCLIAALTFFPIFKMITTNANPALEKAIETVKVEVVSDPALCGDLFNPVGTRVFTAPCDTARAYLALQSVKYSTSYGAAGSGVKVVVNGKDVPYTAAAASNPQVLAAVQAAGYPKAGDAGIVKMNNPFDIFKPNTLAIIGLLFILVIFVTMVYGPIAAMLVELFPTRIRYTSMSLPYHIGNGWFGGLLPATAFAIVASTGDIYAGLWYPVIFASITVVVGLFFLPETKDRDIH